jgi:membrane-bound lytic murein transglycosylase D
MNIKLVCCSGSLKGRVEEFEQETVRMGRKPGNDIVFQDNVVSSFHAEIHRKDSRYILVDLKSTNGTFVNGERVEKANLRDRDKIQLGENGPVLEFRAESEASEALPQVVPVSGSWEKGMRPIPLMVGRKIVGRSSESDIVAGRERGSVVSGAHIEIGFDGRKCVLKDLQSTNGTFVNGSKTSVAQLFDRDRVELGHGGPCFELRWKGHQRKDHFEGGSDSDRMFRKLERAAKGGPVGDRTMVMLQAANRYYKRRRWPLLVLSSVVVVIAVIAGVLLFREKRENAKLISLASNVFYQIRSLDMELVAMRQRHGLSTEIQSATERKEKLKQEYDRYLESLGLYVGKSPTEKSVMRLVRELGETDLEVPPGFYKLLMTYVEKWRRSSGLREALDRARQSRLIDKIRMALNQQGLPRQFLFIALQESSFDARAVGKPTNYGIAKGMWQFIPPTAVKYGLQPGPLKDQRQYDALDERHNELKSIDAAARYLADLYATKAAASGLLVIASYNYGDTRIIRKLDTLRNEPREKSFWNFYRNKWLPEETRDYVMSIVSAALICENPDAFNFAMQPIR